MGLESRCITGGFPDHQTSPENPIEPPKSIDFPSN